MKEFKEFYHANIAWNQGQQPKVAEVTEARGPKLNDIKRKFKKEIEDFQKGKDLDYKAENALLAWALEYTNDIKTDDADEMDDWLMDKIADKKTFDKLKEVTSGPPLNASKKKKTYESFALMVAEGMDFWRVTVIKPINKLKKGRSVVVKARNAAEALKKGAKNMGDPMANQSGYLDAVKDKKESVSEAKEFDRVKEVKAVKKMDKMLETVYKDMNKLQYGKSTYMMKVNDGIVEARRALHTYELMASGGDLDGPLER
jgi:hypothetical protein